MPRLVEVLPAHPALAERIAERAASPDAVVRATALQVLRARGLGRSEVFAARLRDDDHRVRIEAIRGLVARDEADLVASAAGDGSREVRVQVARGLGLIGKPAPVLRTLAADPDPLVRAAALEAAGAIGQPLVAEAPAALHDAAWQVRVGAVRCLGAADPETAVGPLLGALADVNLDVRKAAVLALTPWAVRPEVADALRGATADSDADVRAYARRALAG